MRSIKISRLNSQLKSIQSNLKIFLKKSATYAFSRAQIGNPRTDYLLNVLARCRDMAKKRHRAQDFVAKQRIDILFEIQDII